MGRGRPQVRAELGLVLIVLAGLAGSLLVVRHQFEERQVAPPVPTAPSSPRTAQLHPADRRQSAGRW